VPRPLVAVTATHRRDPAGICRVRLNEAYVRALEGAGLTPLVVPPLADPRAADEILGVVRALVLTGGEDIDPARYGAPRHPSVVVTNAARDATEIALARAARDRQLPTLAICRGIQVLNVALGGTLVQDIPAQRPDAGVHDADDHADPGWRARRVHDVVVDAASRLASALGDGAPCVNSLHHQALDRVADGLRVSARAPDGIIEGIESHPGDPWWALGVQWHPEELLDDPLPWDRRFFAALAERLTEA
jgi:putative glutamine amidotransferase